MLARVPFTSRIQGPGSAGRSPVGQGQPMVRRWRGRLECVFQAEPEVDPWSERLAGLAEQARLRHRRVSDDLKASIGAGALAFDQAARLLTAEGDCNLRAMLSIAEDHVSHEQGPAPGRYAIFGLGKFGGAEMTIGSDLDLLFVYDPFREEDGVAAADYFGRLAQRLTHLLVSAPDWREAYEVDFRLRPHGTDGPLAASLGALDHYLRTDAWIWELQALTRLRAVAGCERLAAEVLAVARHAMGQRCARLDPTAEVGAMRAVLEEERPARHEWDLKLRPGGLVDVEFIAQALQLVSSAGPTPVIAANTGEALSQLALAGYLSKDDAKSLKAAWSLLSTLRQLQAVFGATDLSRLRGAERAALERMTGFTPGALRGRLAAVCGRTRGRFESLICPIAEQSAA
jgi:glutamate-ammonia-ligase adenylyltransferase